MNSSNVQDMASTATLFILLGLLLIASRAWCRGVTRKVAVGSFRSRAALTRRILRAMSWRVGLVVVGLVAFGLLGTDGPRSFATQSFIPAAIWSYPLVLLSLWQIARRISKRILETTPPEQRTHIPPQISEAAILAGRYRPTVIEGIIGAWFVFMLFSFALIVTPNHRQALASVPSKPVETSAPPNQQADRELSPVRLTNGPNRTSQPDAGSLLKSRILEALQNGAVEGVRVLRVNIDPPVAPSDVRGVLRNAVLIIEAQDSSVTPGDGVNPFKEAVGRSVGLQRLLGATESVSLTSLSGIRTAADGSPCVLFTLKCNYLLQ